MSAEEYERIATMTAPATIPNNHLLIFKHELEFILFRTLCPINVDDKSRWIFGIVHNEDGHRHYFFPLRRSYAS